jgi:phytoene dehydrogenase-like protein
VILLLTHLLFIQAKIESHFGITLGHIHHVDNTFGFADRLPYSTPVQGLYSSSAGTHPAGSVIGCAGTMLRFVYLKTLVLKL